MAARVLAVLAAICLVGAFALATLLPPTLGLGELVAMENQSLLVAAQDLIRGRISEWAWGQLAMPLLMRPTWLVPACAGLVLAGASITLGSRKGVPRSHRRRS
jgi:hypothetical protein